MAFGETLAMFVAHQFAVEEGGRFEAERAVEEQLAGGGEEEVGAAHDFGDLHGVVVGDAGELVRRKIVVTPEDKIAEGAASDEGLRTEGEVSEMNCFTIRNTEAPVDAGACRDFFDEFCAAGSGIDGFFFALVRRLECAKDILTRAGAWIKKTGMAQALKFCAVEFDAFALVVRSVRAADVGTFIPREAEPLQVFDKG